MAPFDQQEFYVASPRSEPHVSDDPVLRCLVDGRKLIMDERDWIAVRASKYGADGHCQMCSHTALRRASLDYIETFGGNAWFENVYRALGRGVPETDPSYSRAIPYNDAHGRTHAEVMGMWDRAIAARTAELTRLG